jgi:hypothetical protein
MELIKEEFSTLPDFRMNRTRLHKLSDIIFMSISAVICGADDFVGIKLWADDNIAWLKKHIELENGVPSDDTFRRIFH